MWWKTEPPSPPTPSRRLGSAQAFFSNDALDLGTFVSETDLALSVNFDLVMTTAGSGFGEDFLLGTTGGNQPPVTTVPGTQTVQLSIATAISGITIVDGDAVSAGETLTVVLSDNTGLLSATGTGVSGSGTTHLTRPAPWRRFPPTSQASNTPAPRPAATASILRPATAAAAAMTITSRSTFSRR